MKLNKLVIGAVAIVAAVVLYSNRSVKADQRTQFRSSAVCFLAGQSGPTNIVAYLISKDGPEAPDIAENSHLASAITACLDAGMTMREDGTFFIFTSTLGR